MKEPEQEPEVEVISLPSVSDVRSLFLVDIPALIYVLPVRGSSKCTIRLHYQSKCRGSMQCIHTA